MRLCVLGGHGKTGRQVVSLARLAGHDVRVLEGDARDAAALSLAIHGSEAVISLLGPIEGSAPDFSSRATTRVIEVMKAEGVSRLVAVTGAMCGPSDELGFFYRSMLKIPALAHAVSDRHEQERLIMNSDLAWTILRPPRLTDEEPTSAPVVSEHGPIHALEHCARAHLAQALLDAVTKGAHVGKALYVHTERPA